VGGLENLKFGNLPIEIVDGDRGKNYPKKTDFMTEGVPFLNSAAIKDGRIDFDLSNYITEDKYSLIKKGRVYKNDIILTTRGNGVGKVAIFDVTPEYAEALINAQMLVIRSISGKIDPDYLFYLIKSPEFQKQVTNFSSGSAQPQLPIRDLKDIPVSVLNYDEQLLVGNVLRQYDNLIENNNRRIAILEYMAQSLYREWFVNFRYPGHADNLDADGKPKLIDSPLGQIPEDWEVKVFSESFDFWNGKKCNKSEQGEFNLYGANGIVGKAEAWKYENAVIIGRVGAYCGAVEYCFNRFWGSDNTIIAKCKTDTNISYLFLLLEHFNLNKYAGGSAQPLLTQTTLKQLKYIAPPEGLINEFEKISHKFYEGVVNLKKRNQNLKKQRDMLLPKLISGQIALKD